jgi:hypothetical protein
MTPYGLKEAYHEVTSISIEYPSKRVSVIVSVFLSEEERLLAESPIIVTNPIFENISEINSDITNLITNLENIIKNTG